MTEWSELAAILDKEGVYTSLVEKAMSYSGLDHGIVADWGCGDGRLINKLVDYRVRHKRNFKVVGIDTDTSSSESAMRSYGVPYELTSLKKLKQFYRALKRDNPVILIKDNFDTLRHKIPDDFFNLSFSLFPGVSVQGGVTYVTRTGRETIQLPDWLIDFMRCVELVYLESLINCKTITGNYVVEAVVSLNDAPTPRTGDSESSKLFDDIEMSCIPLSNDFLKEYATYPYRDFKDEEQILTVTFGKSTKRKAAEIIEKIHKINGDIVGFELNGDDLKLACECNGKKEIVTLRGIKEILKMTSFYRPEIADKYLIF